jgi:hypothetical protein
MGFGAGTWRFGSRHAAWLTAGLPKKITTIKATPTRADHHPLCPKNLFGINTPIPTAAILLKGVLAFKPSLQPRARKRVPSHNNYSYIPGQNPLSMQNNPQ